MVQHKVIIIGAGIGGLTAGALLARAGFEIMVIDQADRIGGCCQCFTRSGHRFDAADSMFLGCGPQGYNSLHYVFQKLGLTFELAELDPCYTFEVPGQRFAVGRDLSALIKEMSSHDPDRERQLRRFHSTLNIFRRAVDRIPFERPLTPKEGLTWLLKNWWVLPLLSIGDRLPFTRLLHYAVSDPTLKSILNYQLKAFVPDNPGRTPALLAAILLTETHRGGLHYPRGGSGRFAASLRNVIKKAGGSFLLSNRVTEILVKNERVQGVRLATGELIEANYVISNASCWSTYGQLIKSDHLPAKWLQRVHSLKPTSSMFICYLSLDKDFVESQFAMHTLWPKETTHNPALMLCIPSLVDPTSAPQGKHTGMLYCQASYQDWQGSKNYNQQKNKEIEHLLQNLDQRVPGARSHVQVLDAASPLTIERYTGRDFGSSGGPLSSVDQWHARNLPQKTPLSGLFHVGDSTFPGSGVVAVTISGIIAADQLQHEHHGQ
ncbi:phytoene desaturase family protein [candidate division CSSED10-310 bacterium]|uniref:Phytoene desaturase family protein n=1 Tax=candidate division CSSED10-310 bacterium TaxID=2855610 RepID=A0ABV6Z3E4_UNCC1